MLPQSILQGRSKTSLAKSFFLKSIHETSGLQNMTSYEAISL